MAARTAALRDAWTVTLPATMAGLTRGLHALGALLGAHRVGVESENRARLVFEEIVTNIMRYAYDDKHPHEVRVDGLMRGEDLALTFEDDGRPFDPRSIAEPVAATSLASAQIGGRGLMLVRHAAKHLDYERTDTGRTRVTVTLARV